MLNMSPLLIKACAAAALIAMFAVFEIVTRLSDRAKIKSGEAEDMRKNNTVLKKYNAVQLPRWRYWTEGLLIVACGAALIVLMASVQKYSKGGAFYDSSWRMAGVEKYMHFDAAGNQALQKIYDADPENFDFDAYRVCLVKLGCSDCDAAKDTINALDGTFYVLFTTSGVGKAFVDRYGITFVPSVIYNGTVIELRMGGSGTDPNFVPDEFRGDPDGHGSGDVQGILDDLMDGAEESEPDPSDPGTAGGIEAMYGDGNE